MNIHPTDQQSPRLTREQARAVDRVAMQELGVPGVVLMENAGINAADVASGMLEARGGGRVAVVCGGGNNGGDGYVIARHLAGAGRGVTIYAAAPADKLTGDAAINCGICKALGLTIVDASDMTALPAHVQDWSRSGLIVDALLGTGFDASRGLRPGAAAIIAAINRASAGDAGPYVLAVDTPSGLDCDTGRPGGAAVRADATVTFVARKVGFDNPAAADWLGQVFVAGIGLPPGIIDRVRGTAP